MTRKTPFQTPKDYIIERLRSNQIGTIAVIDDANDDIITDEVRDDQIAEFWTFLRSKKSQEPPGAFKEFTNLCQQIDIEVGGHRDIDNDLLSQLWVRRDTFTALANPVKRLFDSKIQKRTQINRICEQITRRCAEGDRCSIEIKKLGRDVNIPDDLQGASIVFLDYRMGADGAERSVHDAEKIAEQIYEEFHKHKMPLIVLMSSNPALETVKDNFRERSKLLGGLFHFVLKSDLEDQEKLGINLGAWAERREKGGEIQKFVNTIADAIEAVGQEFVKATRSLNLEDYAYIQNLSLASDGQPLGDYMLMLFSAHIGSMLFEKNDAVRTQQTIIDKISFDRLPIKTSMPSPHLIEMYDSALFNKHLGDVSRHPSLPDLVDPLGTQVDELTTALYSGENPSLSHGLLFINDEANEVRMIVNAECDLAFTATGTRVCDADTSILIVPGILQEIRLNQTVPAGVRTEFFRYEEKSYRILWQISKVISIKYQQVLKQLRDDRFTPYARLRLPYALEVQRAFVAHLTRIGMPVAPPLTMPVRVRILGKVQNRSTEVLIDSRDDLAFLVSFTDTQKIDDKHQLRCHLTLEFGHELRRVVNNLIEKYQQELTEMEADNEANPTRLDRLGGKVNKLNTFKQQFDGWFIERHYFQLPSNNELVPLHDLVGVTRNGHAEAAFGDSARLLLIDLIDS
jgi:hypothetical protein